MLYMTKKYRDTLTDEQFQFLLDLHKNAPEYIDSFYCDAADEDGYMNMMAKSYLDNCLREENFIRKQSGLDALTIAEYFAECESRGVECAAELKQFLYSDCGVITCDMVDMK